MKDYMISYDLDGFEHKTKIFCFKSSDNAIEFWETIMTMYPASMMLMNPIMVTFDNEADGEFLDKKFHEMFDKESEE